MAQFKVGDIVVRILDNEVRFINKVKGFCGDEYIIQELWRRDKQPNKYKFRIYIDVMDKDGRLITDDDKIQIL